MTVKSTPNYGPWFVPNSAYEEIVKFQKENPDAALNDKYFEIANRVFGMLGRNKDAAGPNVDRHMRMTWEWPTGVALYGLFKVYKKTGNIEYRNFIENFFKEQFELQKERAPHHNVNTVAPMLTLTFLYEETRDPELLKHILHWVDWVMNDMPRTEFGGLQHQTVLNRHYQQLWADTLFMAVLFLAKAGMVLEQPKWVEEAKYQFLIHVRYLQDIRTGLFYHGWTFDLRHHFANAFWARGNSWYTIASLEMLDILGERDTAFARYLLAAFEDQVSQLERHQNDNGRFATLIDIEESYSETSASAGFAYGALKGVRLGYLDKEKYGPFAQRAVNGVLKMIAEDGTVNGVSSGTGMGQDFDHYKKIPVAPTAFGQGITFLMLTELI